MNRPTQTPESTTLFVYGTLKRGHCRAPMLTGQRFLGAARTMPIYRLVNCGTYPGLIRATAPHGLAVKGELWTVDPTCLARLDEEEGVDQALYERVAVDIASQPALHVEAYLYLRDTASLADCGDCWSLDFERRILGE